MTLEQIVEDVYPRFKGMDKHFEEKSKEDLAIFCHSELSGGISRNIRNCYHLWDNKSDSHNHFVDVHKITHPHEMSKLIVEKVWEKYHESRISK